MGPPLENIWNGCFRGLRIYPKTLNHKFVFHPFWESSPATDLPLWGANQLMLKVVLNGAVFKELNQYAKSFHSGNLVGVLCATQDAKVGTGHAKSHQCL